MSRFADVEGEPSLVRFKLKDPDGSMSSSLLKAVKEFEVRQRKRKSIAGGALSTMLLNLAVQFNLQPEARDLLYNRRLSRNEASFKLSHSVYIALRQRNV